MKAVVTSIVKLALAIVPLTAFAKPTHGKVEPKPEATKIEKAPSSEGAGKVASRRTSSHKSVERSDKGHVVAHRGASKAEATSDKASTFERIERSEKSVIVRVRHEAGKPAAREDLLVQASLRAAESPRRVEKPSSKDAKVGRIERGSSPVKIERGSALPLLPDPTGKDAKKASVDGDKEKPSKGSSTSSKLLENKADREALRKASDDEVAELVKKIRGSQPSEKPVAILGLASATESVKPEAAPHGSKDDAKAKRAAVKSCTKPAVEIIRGPELERLSLMRCDGSIAPLAIEHLSVLVRPGSAPRPTTAIEELAKKKGAEIAHGIRRIDERLAYRLQSIVDHFTKTGSTAKVYVVSGYRPTSIGSMHATGRAIDFRLEGVKNEEVVSFCKTLNDTGCGYYPNSSFVHLDVREPGAGHVAWIDASGPGETPRYLNAWPPPEREAQPLENAGAHEPVKTMMLDELPVDEHPDSPN